MFEVIFAFLQKRTPWQIFSFLLKISKTVIGSCSGKIFTKVELTLLSANPTKRPHSNNLSECNKFLSVFNHFLGLGLKGFLVVSYFFPADLLGNYWLVVSVLSFIIFSSNQSLLVEARKLFRSWNILGVFFSFLWLVFWWGWGTKFYSLFILVWRHSSFHSTNFLINMIE